MRSGVRKALNVNLSGYRDELNLEFRMWRNRALDAARARL